MPSPSAGSSPHSAPRGDPAAANGARGRPKLSVLTAERRSPPGFDRYDAVSIENVWPELEGGRWPIKREVGDTLEVWADVFKDGHDLLSARLLYRPDAHPEWQEAPMRLVENDRWSGSFRLEENVRYRYTVEAWTDGFGSWRADLKKRLDAGQDVRSELLEGQQHVRGALGRAAGADRQALQELLARWEAAASSQIVAADVAQSEALAALLARYPDRSDATRYRHELVTIVDRVQARFAAWYEIFPRSQGTDPTRGSTFREAEARLPAIRAMGFDVVYMTPIHPIGVSKRKGPNNRLIAGPGDPGSPYAIGSADGGHEAIAPELGTLDDFLHFQQVARDLGMELAMDFAIQASPDHPWVTQHPEWFNHRPDGSIKYAENPPKKYEDIYPINFRTPDWKNLWAALRDVVLLWAERGVRIFRVDNPHTKPFAFWEWLIRDVQAIYPDTIFLAEAFTRPKVMQQLAKLGFTQSYTYFTWRNEKWELTQYLTELTRSPMREYFRGNFFANTPDILPKILQEGGRPAFRHRLVLAATLSSVYGIYSGFELCENRARVPDSEYYLDSEMYQHKVWDWNRAGNIVQDVTAINRIRRENAALHEYDNLRFYSSDNDAIIWYGKATPDLSNIILVAVNLDVRHTQSAWVQVPTSEWGIGATDLFVVHDLLADQRYTWRGTHNWVQLDPHLQPAHVFRVELLK